MIANSLIRQTEEMAAGAGISLNVSNTTRQPEWSFPDQEIPTVTRFAGDSSSSMTLTSRSEAAVRKRRTLIPVSYRAEKVTKNPMADEATCSRSQSVIRAGTDFRDSSFYRGPPAPDNSRSDSCSSSYRRFRRSTASQSLSQLFRH